MTPSRRSVLTRLFLGLASLPLASMTRPARSADGARVVVIGAGISGLAAARQLADRGFKVTVLEARDRIGGRLWSDRSFGIPLDLGASWIHGTRGNPVAQLSESLGQPLQDWNYEDRAIIDLTGHRGRLQERADEFLTGLEDFASQAGSHAATLTIRDAVSHIRRKRRIAHLSDAEIGALITNHVELDYAADSGELALAALGEGRVLGGPDAILPRGYDRLAHGLAGDLEVRLSSSVDGIYHSSNGVSVLVNGQTFSADYAIVTVPLGVLKSGRIDFGPPLPDAKRKAIGNLGMGVLNKVYLTFAEPFWEPDALNFIRVSDKPRQFAYWINLSRATGVPVLGALNAGSFARDLEAMDNAGRMAAAHEALRTMFGADLPVPKAGISSAWASDAQALGSYSFLAPGSTSADRLALAASVNDRVFFAGEATSPDFPATVHGALLSGRKAAEEVQALAS
ncbi:flavin monoamine oxidase family protein [Roseibium marinum]|uniref:Tryptophan 2-monooxygenase n=1 Tax=Roseibium marinum TaxID=281252 RepID=A0A2S3UR81_9HYPH|nr:FAD-dependent oxidoreductase [Roseibium marinum]POF30211.1 monoamine oxidase [Roseibium marinum]